MNRVQTDPHDDQSDETGHVPPRVLVESFGYAREDVGGQLVEQEQEVQGQEHGLGVAHRSEQKASRKMK